MNIRIYPAKWRRLLSILLTIAAVVGILVFGESFVSSAAQSMEEPESKEKDVSITNEGFVPEVLAAKIGATITWTNNSSETVFLIGGLDQKVYLPMVFREQLSSTLQNKGQGIHNPLLVAGNSEQASWNSPPIAPAESFSRTYNVVGQFTIFPQNRD
jgi:plastocyanin